MGLLENLRYSFQQNGATTNPQARANSAVLCRHG